MLPNSFTWSEIDSRIDKDGNVYVGYISSIGSVCLQLQTQKVKRSFQVEGDSLRLYYDAHKVEGQFGVVIEQQFEWKKEIKLDQYQLLKETDVMLINQWLDEEAKGAVLDDYFY